MERQVKFMKEKVRIFKEFMERQGLRNIIVNNNIISSDERETKTDLEDWVS